MNKSLTMFATLVVIVGLCFYLVAFGANAQVQANQDFGSEQNKSGPHPLMRYVRGNMAAQAVSEITKEPVDAIRTKMKDGRLPAVLAEYQIDRRAFSEAMRARVQALLGTLVESNYLTADQRDQVLARMDQYAQRRVLMKSLIDKAVTDGTITPDQAQMLLKRPR